MKPQPAEVEALEKSGNLLRFAAENVKEVKELSEPTVSTIATAWKQYEDQNWDPDISTKFWTAYATICALIRPVTLDSLSTNQKNIQVRKWIWFGPFVEASLGDRSARRYLLFLMILLALSLVFGFLSSTANNIMSTWKSKSLLRKLIQLRPTSEGKSTTYGRNSGMINRLTTRKMMTRERRCLN